MSLSYFTSKCRLGVHESHYLNELKSAENKRMADALGIRESRSEDSD